MTELTTNNAGTRNSVDANLAGKYLIFKLADKRFGVAISSIRRILEYQSPQYIPRLPDFCPGVLFSSGDSVPVIDLQKHFGLGATVVQPRSCIIVSELSVRQVNLRVGLLADAVLHVVPIEPDDLEPVPDFAGAMDTGFARGVSRSESAVLLDLDHLFSGTELKPLMQLNKESRASSSETGEQ